MSCEPDHARQNTRGQARWATVLVTLFAQLTTVQDVAAMGAKYMQPYVTQAEVTRNRSNTHVDPNVIISI